MTIDIRKKNLAAAVMAFQQGSLYRNGLKLFEVLGYNTNRTMPLEDPSYKGFNSEFNAEQEGLNKKKAFVDNWKEIQLLFQLTTDEMMEQLPMFQPTIKRDEPASFLFFAIELMDQKYSRSQLANIAREINKPFKMDVFLLFKYEDHITISLIERRPNKKFYEKDVIEKVTHVFNISIEKPHAGHIHILDTFSFDNLAAETRRKKIEGFKDLQIAWKKAVSTQILNKQFYLEYSHLSKTLIRTIHPSQINNKLGAHQGVLNLLNRIMFIYFVQKKEWIMKDRDFVINLWTRYLEEGNDGKNLFHKHWLNTIFFSAFNNKLWDAHRSLKHIPEDLQSAFTFFPYLNGGLFGFHKDYDNFLLDDKHFHDIFKFFEGYIFTITEDTPYDVNLEINPELLGKMYEGMINATDLDDVDAVNGIIYTERPEINFMVRRSIVEVLDKKLNGTDNKAKIFDRPFIYHFLFDTSEEKLQLLRKNKLDVGALRNAVTGLTACDPACGSGSMLLGVIMVQMELLRVIDEFSGKPHSEKDDFKIKKQLISECIYGVDVKEWAVRIAELRLWLYMIAEADFSTEELQKEPLLPNLDFKLRTGNSLLQKFGDLDFTVEDLLKGKRKSAGASKQLNNYIKKKKAFIQNQAEVKTTYEELKEVERAVFIDFIRELITEKEQGIHSRKVKQGSMFGATEQKDLFEEETLTLKVEIEQLKKLRSFIVKERRLPFSYDIDFMEVFMAKDDDPGFDLIIGNPPYVRQEDILPPEDPELLEELLKPKNKNKKAKINKELKNTLNEQVYKIYPFLSAKQTIKVKKIKVVKQAGKKVKKEMEVDEKISVYGTKVPGRSDLYVYFQLICPHYLNSKGTFCFIISNSWLDVEFGAFIQHFLLKHTSLQAIYDCNVRSFDAAVNTIIYLHDTIEYPPLKGGKAGLYKLAEPKANIVRFVMNKVDYIQAAYAPLLIDQESLLENKFDDFFRCIPLHQKELFISGFDEEELKYSADKWGGKYLRAPEIFYNIIAKASAKLTSLGSIAEVYPGCYAGIADFFYVNKKTIKEFKIEKIYLKPLLRNSDYISSLSFTTNEWFVISCNQDRHKILPGLLRYIKWGETQVTRQRQKTLAGIPYPETESVRTRTPGWWSISENNLLESNLFMQYVGSDRFYCPFSNSKYVSDRSFHRINYPDFKSLALSLNSSLTWFFVLLMGRSNLGEGALKFEKADALKLMILEPGLVKNRVKVLEEISNRVPLPIFDELRFDKNKSIRLQQPNPLPDRKALDDIIFDELGLTQDERNEMYWSVAELVKQRLDKAASR